MAWQCALLVATANSRTVVTSSGLTLAFLILSEGFLLLSKLSLIFALTTVLCSLAAVAQAAVTKCHRLGSLNNRHLVFTVLEAGSPRSRCRQVWCLVTCFLVCRRLLSCCVLTWERASSGLFLFLPGHPSRRGALPSLSHLNLITSQSSHLQIPSQWRSGLQHMDLDGRRHSTCLTVHACTRTDRQRSVCLCH